MTKSHETQTLDVYGTGQPDSVGQTVKKKYCWFTLKKKKVTRLP